MKEFDPIQTHITEQKALYKDILGKDSSAYEMEEYEFTSEAIRESARLLSGKLQSQVETVAFELEKLEDEKKTVERILGIKSENEFYSLPEVALLKDNKEIVEDKNWADPKKNYIKILEKIKKEKEKFKLLISQN